MMTERQPDLNAEQEIKNLYNDAVGEWYSQIHDQFPEELFYIIGSGAMPARMRLGQWSTGYTYENARINHILAAISEDSFLKPPSDIDILVPKSAKELAVKAADLVFQKYRIFLHIHDDTLRDKNPFVVITKELLEKGYPFGVS